MSPFLLKAGSKQNYGLNNRVQMEKKKLWFDVRPANYKIPNVRLEPEDSLNPKPFALCIKGKFGIVLYAEVACSYRI